MGDSGEAPEESGGLLVVAGIVGTLERCSGLGGLFNQVNGTAFRAGLSNGFVPVYRIALRVIHTAVKDLSAAGFFDRDLAAVLGTGDPERFAFYIIALRII